SKQTHQRQQLPPLRLYATILRSARQNSVKFARVCHMPVGQQIEFGPFRADPVTSSLLRDGAPVELRPQVFQVLRALAAHDGQFVGYEQMIREAWGGNWVSKHTVAVTVGEVKKILQEYGSWITYRPKMGYRLDVP